jgi:hypothetical protein
MVLRLAIMLLGAAAWPAWLAAQVPASAASPTAPASAAPQAGTAATAPAKAAPSAAPAAAPAAATRVTPNAERIVTIGAIDKRTGLTRDYIGKPGQMFRFGALTVLVRACETTPPWEQPLTGAFLLIDETIGQLAPKRVYSGWMFAQSPSLHPLEHARYDIWVKSCTMRFPETGPATVAAGAVGGRKDTVPKPSNAKKSAATPTAPAN